CAWRPRPAPLRAGSRSPSPYPRPPRRARPCSPSSPRPSARAGPSRLLLRSSLALLGLGRGCVLRARASLARCRRGLRLGALGLLLGLRRLRLGLRLGLLRLGGLLRLRGLGLGVAARLRRLLWLLLLLRLRPLLSLGLCGRLGLGL